MHIFVRRPQEEDKKELDTFFLTAVTYALSQDGLHDPKEIQRVTETKRKLLYKDFVSHGSDTFFLLACTEEKIVGTIAYTSPHQIFTEHITMAAERVAEITSVYIHPEFQKKGIGSLLLRSLLISMIPRKIDGVCLEGGYKQSQSFWKKYFGEPTITLKDYWGEGIDDMLWYRKREDIVIRFEVKD